MIPADLSDLVGKVRKLCRVKSIRIAASAVMDSWDGRCLAVLSFVLEMLCKERKCFCWYLEYWKNSGGHDEMVGKEIKFGSTLPRCLCREESS
jgi:hypothetical protein